MYAVEDDPYCYPGTDVLINLHDIHDPEALSALELELSTVRSEEPLPDGMLDAEHYKAVHHHLFQDVYAWAGESRSVRITKQSSTFCYPEQIDQQLDILFSSLAAADFFRGLSADDFAAKAAGFLATLNHIHAFREGNGRAQLSFVALLAEEAGHPLALERLDPDAMLQAMIASFFGEEEPLTQVLRALLG